MANWHAIRLIWSCFVVAIIVSQRVIPALIRESQFVPSPRTDTMPILLSMDLHFLESLSIIATSLPPAISHSAIEIPIVPPPIITTCIWLTSNY